MTLEKEAPIQQRRATDGILSPNPSNSDIVKLLLDMQRQIDSAIIGRESIARAFKRNRYGEPDYDKHYNDHEKADKAEELMTEYKSGMTKTAVDWATKGLLTLIVAGILATLSIKVGIIK